MKRFQKKLLTFLLAFAMVATVVTPATLTVSAATKTPAKVTKVQEKSATEKSITVKWKKAKNASGYEVWTSTKELEGFKKAATVTSAKKLTATVKKASGKKMKASGSYYVKVKAYYKSGKTKTYGEESAVVKMYTSPNKTGKFNYNDSNMTVTWKKVKNATGYELRIYDRTVDTDDVDDTTDDVDDTDDADDADDEDEAEEVDSDSDALIDTITIKKQKTVKYSVEDYLEEGGSYEVRIYPYLKTKVANKNVVLYGSYRSVSFTVPLETE